MHKIIIHIYVCMCIFMRESFKNATVAPCSVTPVQYSPVDTQLWTLEDANNSLHV